MNAFKSILFSMQTYFYVLFSIKESLCFIDTATDVTAERSKILQIYETLLRKYGADQNPHTKLGRLYQNIKPSLERSLSPLAHSRCAIDCICNRDLCQTCLPLRLQALEAIALIDDPEAYCQKFYIKGKAEGAAHTNCVLCGAPLEPESAVCPYCGTPVLGVGTAGRVEVNSAAEITSVVENALEQVYRYTEFTAKQKNAKEFLRLVMDLTPLEGTIKQQTTSRIEQLELLTHQKMTEQTAMQAAQEQGLSMSVYLRALMDDNAMSKQWLPSAKPTKRSDATIRSFGRVSSQFIGRDSIQVARVSILPTGTAAEPVKSTCPPLASAT